MSAAGMLRDVALKRAGGERPSAGRAVVAAFVAGAAAAGMTYKVLRK